MTLDLTDVERSVLSFALDYIIVVLRELPKNVKCSKARQKRIEQEIVVLKHILGRIQQTTN